MTNADLIAALWELALPKGDGWKTNAWPIVRSSHGDLERAVNTTFAKMDAEAKIQILTDIKLALPEQRKARALDQKNGSHCPQPVGVGRYIRDKRWLDDIGSIAERVEKQNQQACKCGNPATHTKAGTPKCANCWYGPPMDQREKDYADMRRQEWERLGSPRGREACLKVLAGIGGYSRLIGRG